MKKIDITPGTGYCKIEAPNTVWIVSRIMDIADAGQHVQLYQKDHPRRTLTVSVASLNDRKMFRVADAA